MVVTEVSTGGGLCGWALPSPCPGRQSLLPFEDDGMVKQNDWVTSRAQQQLLWDTLQSLKEKAAQAFHPVDTSQPVDPFRDTYNDGGLYGAGCNYAVGFHGIQGRQPKAEDYVLHLALGPDLFAPFNDCTRACLACVLDGHGGTGAVQYVAERFPSYLLADLPRLRAQPAAAMRSALHRIDEELTSLGHNSGTTVNALLLIDNRVTVINTGDCRCILYDWVEERAVQVTHDHNLQSTRERERVLGEGAELSGCGGYVVLPCSTDGAKLLGVTKALGHAGVKALQRSLTMGSLSGILETELSSQELPQLQLPQQLQQQRQQQQPLQEPPLQRVLEAGGLVGVSEGAVSGAGMAGAPPPAARHVSPLSSFSCGGGALWSEPAQGRACASGSGSGNSGSTAGAASTSGMSDDSPVLPQGESAAVSDGPGLPDVDMCSSSCFAVAASSCQAADLRAGTGSSQVVPDAAATPAMTTAASGSLPLPGMGLHSQADGEPCPPAAAAAAAAPTLAASPGLPSQRCGGTGDALPRMLPQPHNHVSSFASAAAMAAAVGPNSTAPQQQQQQPSRAVSSCPSADCPPCPITPSPLAGMGTTVSTSSGGFLLTCEPDEFEFTVEDDRHLVLIGCDGVFDRMSNTEACKTALRQLTTSNSCIDAAREVAHRACRLGSCDNITALVLRFGRKPIVRRQSFSVLSLRRTSSNTSGDLAASGGSVTSRS